MRVESITELLRSSIHIFANPGSHEIFLSMQKMLGSKAKEIGQVSNTQWQSVCAIKANYAAIVKSLAQLSDPTESSSAEATGLGQHIQMAEIMLTLFIFCRLFAHCPRGTQSTSRL